MHVCGPPKWHRFELLQGGFTSRLLSLWRYNSLGFQLKEGESLFDFLLRLNVRFWFLSPLPYKATKNSVLFKKYFFQTGKCLQRKRGFEWLPCLLGSWFTIENRSTFILLSEYIVSSSIHLRNIKRIFSQLFYLSSMVLIIEASITSNECSKIKHDRKPTDDF